MTFLGDESHANDSAVNRELHVEAIKALHEAKLLRRRIRDLLETLRVPGERKRA